jgi:phage terminase large subunit-like protein
MSDTTKQVGRIQVSDLPSIELIEQILERKKANRIKGIFPETGPLRRELYPKHMAHFAAGKEHDERLFLAANKVGKSLCGGFESALHATGDYPTWWRGMRFNHPTNGWVCNNTALDVRDINQAILLGEGGAVNFGTGMIPKDRLVDWKSKSSVPDGVELIYVRHVSGGISIITTKAYEQGRTKFQGRNIHYIWADEEIPADVYGECLLRLMVTHGIIFCTYTPILGLTPVTVSFLRESVNKADLPLKFGSLLDDKKQSGVRLNG